MFLCSCWHLNKALAQCSPPSVLSLGHSLHKIPAVIPCWWQTILQMTLIWRKVFVSHWLQQYQHWSYMFTFRLSWWLNILLILMHQTLTMHGRSHSQARVLQIFFSFVITVEPPSLRVSKSVKINLAKMCPNAVVSFGCCLWLLINLSVKSYLNIPQFYLCSCFSLHKQYH